MISKKHVNLKNKSMLKKYFDKNNWYKTPPIARKIYHLNLLQMFKLDIILKLIILIVEDMVYQINLDISILKNLLL